jgi:hypothetical protein
MGLKNYVATAKVIKRILPQEFRPVSLISSSPSQIAIGE